MEGWHAMSDGDDDWADWGAYADRPPEDCPRGPHRGPEGPNEDIAQCPLCLMPSWTMRPDGEEYGLHLIDCKLPRRHEGRCVPGGYGHPEPARVVRGYFWPEGER
jgi:hypothetical protein